MKKYFISLMFLVSLFEHLHSHRKKAAVIYLHVLRPMDLTYLDKWPIRGPRRTEHGSAESDEFILTSRLA